MVAKDGVQSNDALELFYRFKLAIQLFPYHAYLLEGGHRMKKENIRTAMVAAVTGLSLDCPTLIHCF